MCGVGLPVERHRNRAAGFSVSGSAFEYLSGLGLAVIQRAITGKGGNRDRRQKIFTTKLWLLVVLLPALSVSVAVMV